MTGVDQVDPERVVKGPVDLTSATLAQTVVVAIHDGSGGKPAGLYRRDEAAGEWKKGPSSVGTPTISI